MFEFVRVAHGSALYKEVLKLRYRVYVDQCGFESPEDNKNGMETDKFDDYSVHFVAAHSETKKPVGTVRIILKSHLGFPIEQHFKFYEGTPKIAHECLAEISRIAVDNATAKELGVSRKDRFDLVLGLIEIITKAMYKLGITHVYAVMENSLFVRLRSNGIEFTKIGESVDYHGVRAPYFGRILDVINNNERLLKAYC